MGPRIKKEKTSRAIIDDSKDLRSFPKSEKKAKANKPTAPAKKESAAKKDDQPLDSDIPFQLHQRCLNIFQDALWTGSDDIATVQEVKGHLYNRDFAKAFGSEPYLRAYALRWSAARALGYLQVFESVWPHLAISTGEIKEGNALHVLALGAGAGAELVALAGFLSLDPETRSSELSVELVDIADWDAVVQKLDETLKAPPTGTTASMEALIAQDRFKVVNTEADVLDWDDQTIVSKAASADLTTIMFTLNELYSTSVPKTQRLLYSLTSAIRPGALLLVVDSPGSYSTVTINGSEKKYPMQWLLDHTMLSTKAATGPAWEKVATDESKWFRLPGSLQYPIKLENMRYQFHLYRRLANSSAG